MKIDDIQQLLILDYDLESEAHDVEIRPATGDTVDGWSANTRVSPVWCLQLDDHGPPSQEIQKEIKALCFIASSNPATLLGLIGTTNLMDRGYVQIWLSLGSFNLLIATNKTSAVERLVSTCEGQKLTLEIWELQNANKKRLNESFPEFATIPVRQI